MFSLRYYLDCGDSIIPKGRAFGSSIYLHHYKDVTQRTVAFAGSLPLFQGKSPSMYRAVYSTAKRIQSFTNILLYRTKIVYDSQESPTIFIDIIARGVPKYLQLMTKMTSSEWVTKPIKKISAAFSGKDLFRQSLIFCLFVLLFEILYYAVSQEANACNKRDDGHYFQRRANVT